LINAQAEKLENPKSCHVILQRGEKIKTGCYKMKLNPSNDRALHEGDNPSFCLFVIFRHTQQFFSYMMAVSFYYGRKNTDTLYNVFGERPSTFCK
jgi:hypothetical protein